VLADVDQAGPAVSVTQRDTGLTAALAGAGLVTAGYFPFPACLAPEAGAPCSAGLAAARPRADMVPDAPWTCHPPARRVQQVRSAEDLRGGAGEPGQDIEHGIVDEQLAVSFPHGQREAKHRAHRLLPRLSVLVLGSINRQYRLRLVPADQDAVADFAGTGDGKHPPTLEQRHLPGHRRRAEPRVVEYLGRELRASPRRRVEPAVGARPVAAERRPVRQPQSGQDQRQLDRPRCRRGAEVPRGVGLLDLCDARRAQPVGVD
jgi:hypothetical protein